MDLESLIEARPTRRENLHEWYAALLEFADSTGTTVAELADRIGCSRETIYAWRRRLRVDAGAAPASAPGLVRVHVAEQDQDRNTDRLEIRTRGGHTVVVPSSFDSSALAAVVAVLEQC